MDTQIAKLGGTILPEIRGHLSYNTGNAGALSVADVIHY